MFNDGPQMAVTRGPWVGPLPALSNSPRRQLESKLRIRVHLLPETPAQLCIFIYPRSRTSKQGISYIRRAASIKILEALQIKP